jgi:predicted aspartyl protease
MQTRTLYLYRQLIPIWTLSIAFLVFSGLYASAQNYLCELGINEYQKQNYARAITLFENSLFNDPSNSETFYYAAITYEKLGNYKKALRCYQEILDRFPNSKTAALATDAINRPEFRKVARMKGLLTGIDSASDVIPRETWVDFTRVGNSVVVDGVINGNATKMIFDTGASACVFSVDQLKRLGISIPTGAPSSFGAGVGSKYKTPMWNMVADLKLGKIERHNFPILVSANPLPYPLLGENYYHDLEYTIDNPNKIILFKSRSQQNTNSLEEQIDHRARMTINSSGKYVYNVPFEVDNQSLVVVAKIDGKDCKMIFDTGADVCLFTEFQIQQLGIKVRSTGKTSNLTGTGGITKAPVCIIENAQVGPISSPMVCLITNQTLMPKPLLGQTFFKNWHFTIDHVNKVIQFVKE